MGRKPLSFNTLAARSHAALTGAHGRRWIESMQAHSAPMRARHSGVVAALRAAHQIGAS
jgi:hypothetical protein